MVDCFMHPIRLALLSSKMLILPDKLNNLCIRGVVGQGRGPGQRPPLFSTGETRPLLPHSWTEISAKVSPLLQLVTY